MADPLEILKLGQGQTQAFLGILDRNMSQAIAITQANSQLEFQAASALYTAAENKRMHDVQIEGIRSENATRAVQAQVAQETLKMQRAMQPLQYQKAQADLKFAQDRLVSEQFSQAGAGITNEFVTNSYSKNLNNEAAAEYQSAYNDAYQRILANPTTAGVEMASLQTKARDIANRYKDVNPEAYKTYDPTTARNMATFGMKDHLLAYSRNNPAILPSKEGIRFGAISLDPRVRAETMEKYGHLMTPEEHAQSDSIVYSQMGLDSEIRSLNTVLDDVTARYKAATQTLQTLPTDDPEYQKIKSERDALSRDRASMLVSIDEKRKKIANLRNTFGLGVESETDLQKNNEAETPELKEARGILNKGVAPQTTRELFGRANETGFESVAADVGKFGDDLDFLQGYDAEEIRKIKAANVGHPDREKEYIAKYIQSLTKHNINNLDPEKVRGALKDTVVQRILDTLSSDSVNVFSNPNDIDYIPTTTIVESQGAGPSIPIFNPKSNLQKIRKGDSFRNMLGKLSDNDAENDEKLIDVYSKVLAAKFIDRAYAMGTR